MSEPTRPDEILMVDNEKTINGKRERILGRLRNEFQIELLITAVCFLLAFGLTTKLIVAITVACLRFAIPDVITGLLVLRRDPDRWHGISLAFLFLALGMCRTVSVALVGLVTVTIVGVTFKFAPGPVFLASLSTCALIVYGFLLLIFPSTFIAFVIAKLKNMKLYFAHELTRIRKSDSESAEFEKLDIEMGLRLVAIGSAISLAIVVCSSLFIFAVFPNAVAGMEVLFVMLVVFAAPPIWIWQFISTVTPPDMSI